MAKCKRLGEGGAGWSGVSSPKAWSRAPLPLTDMDELFSGASGDHTDILCNSPGQPRRIVSPCSQVRDLRPERSRQEVTATDRRGG